MARHELSNDEWQRIEPHLPPRKAGAVRKDDRIVINGILWKLTTGAPWRDLPERYGPWKSIHTRFRRWTAAGVWDTLFAAIQREADAAGQIDWDVHFVDGTTIRAHQHAAGAKGGAQKPKRLDVVVVVSRPRSTSAPKGVANR